MQEGGTNLSGGQKQRIALARAFYKESPVLILDEATSALDNESEKKIAASIEEAMGEKIVIAIAHRLGTIVNFDLIYVLKEGQILAYGVHEDLMQNCDYYRELYEKSIKE